MATSKIPDLPPINDDKDIAKFNDVVESYHELKNMLVFIKKNKLLNCGDEFPDIYHERGIQVWRALYKLKKILDAQSEQ